MARTDTPPRNPGTRGGSERRGFAGRVVTKGFLAKVVKPPGLNVSFELPIPRRPIVFEEPSTKLRELRWGERLDLFLDLLDLAHDLSTGASFYHSARAWSRALVLLANVCAQGACVFARRLQRVVGPRANEPHLVPVNADDISTTALTLTRNPRASQQVLAVKNHR
jgi:hypothetical protein